MLMADPDYDLVLVDLMMPGESGLELIIGLQNSEHVIPVAAISGETNPALIQQVLAQGILGFIPKNHPADQIRRAIKTMLTGCIRSSDDEWAPRRVQCNKGQWVPR